MLAACPIAKSYGITTAETLKEALAKCPEVIVVRPHMQQYIDVSSQITDILRKFSDQVEPYSIDEQFIDVSGSLSLFGSPREIATAIQDLIRRNTGVRARIGIDIPRLPPKWLATCGPRRTRMVYSPSHTRSFRTCSGPSPLASCSW